MKTVQDLLAFLPRMTATFTAWFQTVAWLAQAVDVSVLPEPYRSRAIAIVGLIQAIQAVMAHHYAPNGQKLTPGSPAYLPPPAPPKDNPPPEAGPLGSRD